MKNLSMFYLILRSKLKNTNFLFRKKHCKKWLFCTEGCFKIYHVDSNGKEHIQFATQNYGLPIFRPILIKPMLAFFTWLYRRLRITIIILLETAKNCSKHKIEHFFLEENQFWLCPLQQRILSMLNNNPQERYDKLHFQPNSFQKYPKIHCFYLVSRETLSRSIQAQKRVYITLNLWVSSFLKTTNSNFLQQIIEHMKYLKLLYYYLCYSLVVKNQSEDNNTSQIIKRKKLWKKYYSWLHLTTN
jgi:hypothetical protein